MLHLHTLWYIIIAFFWTGFFVLEGFDFGVGMLHAVVGRTAAAQRRSNSASGHYVLVVMSVVAMLLAPVVLLY